METRHERHKRIVAEIIDFSEIFETFATGAGPIFLDTIPTACITFNKEGNSIGFCWGKDFFDSCSDYKARFVLCHEMLHIFLRHGRRMTGLTNHNKFNICADISINHLLVDEFGFVRANIEGWKELCWRDTVFNRPVAKMSTFEGYYALDDSFFKEGYTSLDHHVFPKEEEKELSEEQKEFIDDLGKKLGMTFPPSQGDEPGFLQKEFKVERVKKPKFDSLVKKITASLIEKKKENISSWITLDRRLCEVAPDLPAENKNHERVCRKRFKCAFFIDNSGSCADYTERFCKAAASLNEKVFEVDVYSFDTRVLKVDKIDGKYKVRGGGGTCFNCIEREVNKINPDIVFVVTDGFASSIEPKDKKKYFWFLTEDGTETAIRNAGKRYRLSQYE